MKANRLIEQGLLINAGHRDAGEGEINGRIRQWKAADRIVYIKLFDEKGLVMRRDIQPEFVQKIYDVLDEVSWGAVIEVTILGKQVVSVEVISDILTDFRL